MYHLDIALKIDTVFAQYRPTLYMYLFVYNVEEIIRKCFYDDMIIHFVKESK